MSHRGRFPVLLAFALIAGCTSAGDVAGPREGSVLSAVRSMASIAEPTNMVRCEFGVRSPGESTFRTYVGRFQVDPSLTDVRNRRARFRIPKRPSVSDPTRVVACEIPDSPGADAYFARVFRASAAELSTASISLPPTSSSARVTTVSATMDGECPPEALQCDYTGSGEWEGPAPTDADIAEGSVYQAPTEALRSVRWATGRPIATTGPCTQSGQDHFGCAGTT